uniref:Uncharacterized protein n=1 Tax=Rhizophora mucronata TaxID=61149 RepID=A0A2P2NIF9_RHIMU
MNQTPSQTAAIEAETPLPFGCRVVTPLVPAILVLFGPDLGTTLAAPPVIQSDRTTGGLVGSEGQRQRAE